MWIKVRMSDMQSCRDYLLEEIASRENLYAFAAGLLDPRATDFPFVYVNHRMVQLTGFPEKDYVGRSFQSWFGANTDTETRLHTRLSIQSDQYTESDLLCYRRSGSSFWNRVTLTPIRDEDGRTSLFLVSGQDITRIRRLEDALLQPSQLTERTTRSMQLVIEKTEARFLAVRQFQGVLVAHLERGWRRYLAKSRGTKLSERDEEAKLAPVFAERRPTALMGSTSRRSAQAGPAPMSARA